MRSRIRPRALGIVVFAILVAMTSAFGYARKIKKVQPTKEAVILVPHIGASISVDRMWTAPLTNVLVPTSQTKWSSGQPVSVVPFGTELGILDKGNHSVLVLDNNSGGTVRIIGGFGQGPGDLAYPSDMDEYDGRILIADWGNARVTALDPGTPAVSSIYFDREVLQLETLANTAYVLTRKASEVALHTGPCCSAPLKAVVLRGIDGRSVGEFSVLHDGRIVIVTAETELSVFSRNGNVEAKVRLVPTPQNDISKIGSWSLNRIRGVTAGTGSRVLINLGPYALCYDVSRNVVTAWRPKSAEPSTLPLIRELSTDGSAVYVIDRDPNWQISRLPPVC